MNQDGRRIRKNVAELLRNERTRADISLHKAARDLRLKSLDLWYYEYCLMAVPANVLMSLLAYYQTDLETAEKKLGIEFFFSVD